MYYVRAATEDPVFLDLAKTTHALLWDYDGSKVYYQDREKTCWSTSWPANWRVDSCAFTYFGIIDGQRTVASTVDSAFHNYDFWNPLERTDVTHHIYLEGYKGGGAHKYVTWTASGEHSGLLDLDIFEFHYTW